MIGPVLFRSKLILELGKQSVSTEGT
jgi:hypothetical protein